MVVFPRARSDKIGGEANVGLPGYKPYGCWFCTIRCGGKVRQDSGKFALEKNDGVGHKPEYETLCMAGGVISSAICIYSGALKGGLPGAALGAAVALTLVSVMQSVCLNVGLKFSVRAVWRPWLQAIGVGGLTLGIFYLLRPWLESARYHNLVFMVVMAVVSLLLSGGLYLLLEGRNPFRDRGGASRREAVPV